MAVTGNKISELGDALLIKLNEPYLNVSQVLSYTDETIGEDTDNYFQKSFRWSCDGETYSEFLPLDDLNLANLELDSTQEFWIEYKYEAVELMTGHCLEFVSIALEVVLGEGELQAIPQVNVSSCDPSDSSCVGNLTVGECCDPDNLFRPYDLLNAANPFYEYLSDLAGEIFGHCVKYYQATPDTRTQEIGRASCRERV